MSTRPTVFIGSSVEGLSCAKAIQANLDRVCQSVIWHQGVFGLSGGTLESLLDYISKVDFAILVVTPDDTVISRDTESKAPRDNVLLELGMCMGKLGRDRCFLVHDRTKELKLPTDLAGITNADYEPHDDGNLRAALGPVCTEVEEIIGQLGGRTKYGSIGLIDEAIQFRVVADLLGEVACNFLIQMHASQRALWREPAGFGRSKQDSWYIFERSVEEDIEFSGAGYFSTNELCEKLPEADIVAQDLKNNITLTDRGCEFAEWLVENEYKAAAFISNIGGWGKLSPESNRYLVRFEKKT